MHDVIRDMALWIAGESEMEKFLVQAGFKLKKLPATEKWEKARRVSLMDNQIENLNEMLACPNLHTLFLASTKLHVISNNFFKFMPKLRVLDLSRNFDLKELPIGIAKLVSLEHLNLSHTKIRELPAELKALEKLKYLNLEWTMSLEMIPEQLLFNLSKLQVLKMLGCGCEWLVEEIEHLKDLEVLTISFKSASMLERALGSSKFKSSNVEAVRVEDFKGSRSLNILDLANPQHLYRLVFFGCKDIEEMKMESVGIASAGCFQSLRNVTLLHCPKLKNASWVIFAPHLEVLDFQSCDNLEEIVSYDEVGELMGNSNLFSKLKVLVLATLPNLKTIYRDVLPFPQLKKIAITRCPMLKKLPLNSDEVGELKALEKLKYLNLEWAMSLEMIPEQLISNLSKLQVLKMLGCDCEWPVEEIEHLKDLEVLTISFKSASMLERALGFSKFKSCNVEDASVEDFKGSRSLNILDLANLQHLYHSDNFEWSVSK